MPTPLFSIITITFNAASTLPATIASVDAQDCADFEHLIIDGNSRDETMQIVADAATPYRHAISEPDKGLYDAMNKGLARATGKYLIFLNAGDRFASPATLGLYAQAALADADIIYSDTALVNAEGNIVGPRHLSVPERLTFKSFAKGMLICHQAFCVKRSIAPAYNLAYRFSADYEWCLRCIKAGDASRFVNLHTVGIHYLTDGLTDNNRKASLKERYKIMCLYYGRIPTLVRHIGFAFRAFARRF